MADFAELAFEAANPVIENYDKVTDPVMAKAKELPDKIRSARGRNNRDDYYEYERYDDRRDRGHQSRGGDYEYVDEKYERRDSGRARSAGRDGYGGRGLRDDRRRQSRRSYSSSASESSISPRRAYKHRKSLGEQALAALGLGGVLGSEHEKDKRERRRDSDRYRRDDRDRGYSDSKRVPAGYLGYNERQDYRPDGSNAGAVARRNNNDSQSAVTKRTGDYESARGEKRKSSSPSSDSSSDVCSSSEDERRTKKMKGKEFLTAGLAAVATIHAAHGVYSSMEARDKRHAEVAKGEMTPEESARLRRKAHLQDAAAIGIAALGIKGAYSEWQEVQEHRKELANEKQEQAKRHEKRMKKRSKYEGSSYGDRKGYDGRYRSEPDLNRGYRDQGR
ncbi:MAG: hypothetical protein LQ352_007453 [Teloschistes flavicans]|nr:MAG: hypothetical protein LQ352_007453 [Teloschistes flavicans]